MIATPARLPMLPPLDLGRRQRRAEWMDEPDVDPRELGRSLAFIRRVNRFLGYKRATLQHLERFSKRWQRGRTIRILDLATGSADIPLGILNWATRRGFDVRVVALDLHEATVAAARASSNDARLKIVRGNALCPPFDDGSFEYVHTAMFLHHLDDDDVVTVMKQMNRIAARGVIVADLIRSAAAYRWIRLFTMFSEPMVKHDARVSVLQAFTPDEARSLGKRAGLNYATYQQHFAKRFALAGEKC